LQGFCSGFFGSVVILLYILSMYVGALSFQ